MKDLNTDILLSLPDIDNNRTCASFANFKSILNHYKLKAGINVFTKESGIFREDNSFLEDADIIEILDKHKFPLSYRNSFIEKSYKRGEKINIFKEKLENTILDPYQNYIESIRSAIKDSEGYMEHIPHDSERKNILLKMWLTYLLCIFYQGTVFDKGQFVIRNVLVLQGKQGIGKSLFFNSLIPKGLFHQADNFPEDRDDLDIITKSLVTEIAEFDSMTPKELNRAKSFISRKEDTYRKPYAREAIKYPRMTTFIGTTNRSAMLKDSENTRFWIWEVEEFNHSIINKTIKCEEDKWKFWKEVSSYYKGPERLFKDIIWLNRLYKEQNEKFRLQSDIEERLSETLDLERMNDKDFDGFLPSRMLLCIAYRNMTYKSFKNDEYAVVGIMDRLSIKRKTVRVKPKKNIDSSKYNKTVYPVSLTKEAIEWIELNVEADIYIK